MISVEREFIRLKPPTNSLSTEESIYLYLKQSLDPSAKLEFEKRLKIDSQFAEKVEDARSVLLYSQSLSKIYVSDELKTKVLESTTYWSSLSKKINISNWPRELSLFAESLALGLVVFFMLQIVPWSSLKKWWVVGVESIKVEREKDTTAGSEPDNKSGKSIKIADSQSKTKVTEVVPGQLARNEVQKKPVSESKKDSKNPASSARESGAALSGQASQPQTQPAVNPQAKTATHLAVNQPTNPPANLPVYPPTKTPEKISGHTTQTLGSTAKEGQRRGYVYRLFMDLKQLDQFTPAIAQKIKGLGGQKAGDVPLGWKRGEGSYYHFTLPETQYDSLLTVLKSYGPVRISKDPHPRVMPEGEIRLILWIESLDARGTKASPVNKSDESGENDQTDSSSIDQRENPAPGQ